MTGTEKQFEHYRGPSIDHGILSPSGYTSKRAEKAAKERAGKELFPNGLAWPSCPQPTEAEYLLRKAAGLRQLAERGMCPVKYRREAERLEAKARGGS